MSIRESQWWETFIQEEQQLRSKPIPSDSHRQRADQDKNEALAWFLLFFNKFQREPTKEKKEKSKRVLVLVMLRMTINSSWTTTEDFGGGMTCHHSVKNLTIERVKKKKKLYWLN